MKILAIYGSLGIGVLAVEAAISANQQVCVFPLALLFVVAVWLWAVKDA
ncbi:MAG: hypothetical protein N2117_12945 [Anaerolineales bacterium]|nr:hypothetical protein [Anaerolineales bacterium]